MEQAVQKTNSTEDYQPKYFSHRIPLIDSNEVQQWNQQLKNLQSRLMAQTKDINSYKTKIDALSNIQKVYEHENELSNLKREKKILKKQIQSLSSGN